MTSELSPPITMKRICDSVPKSPHSALPEHAAQETGRGASAHGQRDLEAAGSAMPPIQEDVVLADKLAAHLLVVLRGAAVRADLDEESVAGEVGGKGWAGTAARLAGM